MSADKFLCNCHYEFHIGRTCIRDFSDIPVRNVIVSHLSKCGYDVHGVQGFLDTVLHNVPHHTITIDTYRNGTCRVDSYDYKRELFKSKDPLTVECPLWCDFELISSLRIEDEDYLTNGFQWWRNEKHNRFQLAAVKRMGFHSPTVDDINTVLTFGRHFDGRWQMDLVNKRATGLTTRLVDKYVQDLFRHPGEWVDVYDHYPKHSGQINLMNKLRNRMWNEHHLQIDVNENLTKARINERDINFFN